MFDFYRIKTKLFSKKIYRKKNIVSMLKKIGLGLKLGALIKYRETSNSKKYISLKQANQVKGPPVKWYQLRDA